MKGIAGSQFIIFLYLLKDSKTCNLFICLCICLRHGPCVEVGGNLKDSGHEGWWQVPVSTLILVLAEDAPLRKYASLF